METIYYHLNARRVKVAGGPDLMAFSQSHAAPVPASGGQLLDFERGKLRLERKALLQNVLEPEALPEEEDPIQDLSQVDPLVWDRADQDSSDAPSPRAHKLFLGLDLLASGAILAVCVTIIRAFTAVL